MIIIQAYSGGFHEPINPNSGTVEAMRGHQPSLLHSQRQNSSSGHCLRDLAPYLAEINW
ncbi:conserved hypothetical protein [Ricinus communis]|uniref:Uncharacterized protein n=1 Tax=Ricinus communis TaxID=3988 RepID=B9RJ29_RICCO|nr:conserved hypothetical protein [Ricinus communis]